MKRGALRTTRYRTALLSVFGLFLVIGCGPLPTRAEEPLAIQLEAKMPLGNVAGRIDHMAVDLKRRRLFIAELGNNTVGVVDLASAAVAHRLSGFDEPQGVAFLAERDTLYVANGGDGSVRIYEGDALAAGRRIGLGSDADNIRFDNKAGRLLVGYGGGALSVIDPVTAKPVGDYALKAHPESFQIDEDRNRIFVNLPGARAIAVLDRATGKLLAQWPLSHAANFAMTLDRPGRRLFAVFRRPAKLAAYAADDGKLIAEQDTCGDADDLFFDAKRQRIYVVCGEGFVDIFDAGEKPRRLGRILTIEGARTGLFVPELDRLYVAARAHGREAATLWVFAP
jgi:hypothetical protein